MKSRIILGRIESRLKSKRTLLKSIVYRREHGKAELSWVSCKKKTVYRYSTAKLSFRTAVEQ